MSHSSGRAPIRLAWFSCGSFAASPTCAAAQEPHPAPPGERRTLHSAVLGEECGTWVSLPASYDDTIHARQAYPVLYLLDAEWNFPLGLRGRRMRMRRWPWHWKPGATPHGPSCT